MSLARTRFLETMDGAFLASQSNLLLDPAGAPHDQVQAARLLRNGLAVTTFAAFEGFIRERTGEIAAWLTSQSVPYSGYPAALQSAPLNRGLQVLSSLLKIDDASPDAKQAVLELAEAWTRMGAGGGWRLPHVALLWAGSNLSAGDCLSILQSVGVATDWNSITAVAEAAGFQNLPTKNLFNEIAGRRHSSAHDSKYDADIVVLRATPGHLHAFAFAFDVLISHAARAIAKIEAPKSGRAAMTLTRLDETQAGGSWEQHNGNVSKKSPTTPVASHGTGLQMAINTCVSSLSQTTDVLIVRKWTGTEHTPATWHTSGV